MLRVIARLNVGGATIQAISLTRLLEPLGYRTTLVRGIEGPREGSMDYLAQRLGVRPVRVRSLRRELGWHDVAALRALVRLVRRDHPLVLHTHGAKAGTIARLAVLIAGAHRPPVIVHTFHGHVLTGYFSKRKSAVFIWIERHLARFSTRLIAVSDEVRDDLVRLGVAPRRQIEMIPLGFDLSRFDVDGSKRVSLRVEFREALGIPEDATVVTLIARLVPIKRVDRFLAVAMRLADLPGVRFVIVGDGELRESLESSPAAQTLGDSLVWAGFRRDIPAVCFGSDLVALTSDNEGTPVSLIEAQAAGVPVVTTEVGGAASAIVPGESGYLIPREDEEAFAQAVRTILDDVQLATAFGLRGREHVLTNFTISRLVSDIDELYRRLLARADA